MAEPDWNPDTGGRPLAEILREAGIDTSRAAKRRRWDEPDEPVRQRKPDTAPAADRPVLGRRRSDAEAAAAPGAGSTAAGSSRSGPGASRAPAGFPPVRPTRAQDRTAVAGPSTAAIPGLRPDRSPAVPHPSAPLPDIPLGALRGDRGTALHDDRPTDRDTGRTGRVADRDTGRTGLRTGRPAQRPSQRSGSREEHSSTGPIPVVHGADVDDLDEDTGPLAWLRFAGELVIALAAGVGVFFAATLLWEMAPYLALLLVPLAVSALVGGVGMWRRRQGAEPVGPRLLALLVLAGTLLTIVPAAQLLAAR